MNQRKKEQSHGTQGGYSNHRYHNEKPCDACRIAHNKYSAAQTKAARKLAKLHPEEYKKILKVMLREAGVR